MFRFQTKHWALLAGFLTATASVLGGLDHWSDAIKPAVSMGIVGQIGVLIGSLFAGAPPNPNLNARRNPARRTVDPKPPID